jgi:hypothetical protein
MTLRRPIARLGRVTAPLILVLAQLAAAAVLAAQPSLATSAALSGHLLLPRSK